MSQRRLVLVDADDRTTVPLSAVVDVIAGHVPLGLRDLFDDTVTLAYRDGSATRTVLVESDPEAVALTDTGRVVDCRSRHARGSDPPDS
jgi:hypothetical protein